MQSQEINELAKALVAAQSEMDFAKKDSENPFFRSSYADLASVWEVCRQVLPKNNLAVTQTMEPCEEKFIQVCTILMHISGQWVQGTCKLPIVKNDPQSAGSAITYARRYSLAAIVGVIASDDDAEGAMSRDRSYSLAVDAINACETADDLKNLWVTRQPEWGKLQSFKLIVAAKDVKKKELEVVK